MSEIASTPTIAPEAASPAQLNPTKFTFSGAVEVLDKPGAVKLCHVKYPHLVYAPIEHGAGIRTEDHGVLVSDICTEIAVNPDHEAVAAKFGTSVEHVRQAVAYGLDTKVLSEGTVTP